MYFMGVSSGESKKTGSKWCALHVLRQNRWGSIEVKPLFCNPSDFEELRSICPPVGSAVDVKLDLDGQIIDITPVKDIPVLDLR